MAETYSAGKPKVKGPKILAHMSIEPVMGGGVNVIHHHSSEHPSERHKFGPGDGAAFTRHMLKHTGLQMKDIAQAEHAETDVEGADE